MLCLFRIAQPSTIPPPPNFSLMSKLPTNLLKSENLL